MWEEQAVNYLNTLHNTPIEERLWLAILAERSAFKHDVFDAPIADVVEVVRCKYCQYLYADSICGRESVFRLVNDNGFCDKGKRREDD